MVTLFGSSGFIGSNLNKILINQNIEVSCPSRSESQTINGYLGDVVYCIGMTADFRSKPYETIDSHINVLKNILKHCTFDSLVYLSSTRLYLKSNIREHETQLTESTNINIDSLDPFDIFAASKICGEILALNCNCKNVKILRISNVYGLDFYSENFLTDIIKSAIISNQINLRTHLSSSKDFIFVEDVCMAILALLKIEDKGIYNICYGKNFSNNDIVKVIQDLTNCSVSVDKTSTYHNFFRLSNKKLLDKTGYVPKTSLLDYLPEMINLYKISLR